MGRWVWLVLRAAVAVGATASTAQEATAPNVAAARDDAAGIGANGCPTLHVYLDVSGSVLKPLPENGQQTGYKLALQRLRHSVAPHIDGMGATLLLYRFGPEVDQPIAFHETQSFLDYIGDLERAAPAPRRATNLTRVWRHILERAKGAAGLQDFVVFSDFAQSSIAARSASAGASRATGGDDLNDWRMFLAENGEAIRAAVDHSFVRLVRLPAQREYQDQQTLTLQYFMALGSRVRARVVDVASPDWDDFGKQTRYVDLQLEDGRLRLRNVSCAVVTAEELRLRRADGSMFPESRPSLELAKGGTGYWAMPTERVVRVGVMGRAPRVGAGLLSDELSMVLRTGDLSAIALLFGRTMQVFITPKVPLGAAVEGQVEVLASTGAGEKRALHERVRIPDNAAAQAAPVRGRLSFSDAEAVARGVRLRLTPEAGNPIEVPDVPVLVLPGVQFDVRWGAFVVALLTFAAGAFGARASGWRLWRQGLSGVGVLASLFSAGKWAVALDGQWVRLLFAVVASLLGAWCGWCTVVTALPTERRPVGRIAGLLDEHGKYSDILLRPWVYTRARLIGLAVAVVAGVAAWWLLTSTYTELGEQRLPLDLLRKTVEGM